MFTPSIGVYAIGFTQMLVILGIEPYGACTIGSDSLAGLKEVRSIKQVVSTWLDTGQTNNESACWNAHSRVYTITAT